MPHVWRSVRHLIISRIYYYVPPAGREEVPHVRIKDSILDEVIYDVERDAKISAEQACRSTKHSPSYRKKLLVRSSENRPLHSLIAAAETSKPM